eukprot:jgi/Chrpa1/7372/Chrysochromulina_OHIO_Genome00016475-RA
MSCAGAGASAGAGAGAGAVAGGSAAAGAHSPATAPVMWPGVVGLQPGSATGLGGSISHRMYVSGACPRTPLRSTTSTHPLKLPPSRSIFQTSSPALAAGSSPSVSPVKSAWKTPSRGGSRRYEAGTNAAAASSSKAPIGATFAHPPIAVSSGFIRST